MIPSHFRLLLCFLLLGCSWPLQAQQLFFDIYHGEDKIGQINARKTSKHNRLRYEVESEAEIRVIFKNEIITRTVVDMTDNELTYCMSKTTLNGKIRDHATIKKDADAYSYFKHPEETFRKKTTPFSISSIFLFFREPTHIRQVFSEKHQQFCTIKPLGNSTYALELPDGKLNHYVYKNGQLVEVKVFRSFFDLSFRLREQS